VPELISLRYHIVSLVAVFLALALGIVVGSTVLREGTVSILRATSEQVRQSNESYRQENFALKEEQARLQDFSATVLPDLVRGRLKDRPVVLLDTDKVDGGVRDRVSQVLGAAGAEVDGRVTFNAGRLVLGAEGDRQALGRLLPGANAADPAALRNELVRRVADRLGTPEPLPTQDPARKNDLLTSLDDGGFLADLKLAAPVADGSVPFPRPGSVVVIIGPTDGVPLPPEAFLIPLADEVSLHVAGPVAGVEALAAGTTPGTTSWITKLRQDRLVTRNVSGIDDVDTVYGQLALVGALERGLRNLASGQYGFKSGNSGLLPEKVPAS
jgi:Copper transport outer membrane protein, MctB